MVSRMLRLVGGGAFILYVGYVAQPGTSLFSWHPFLMALAFTGLMTEAVFTFSKPVVGSGQPHSTKVTNHWMLLVATAVAHALGVAAIYFTKEANKKPHFTTLHSCLGGLTALLLWVQLGGGLFSKYPHLLGSFLSLKTLRAGHSLSGTMTYAAAMLTICLGLGSMWFRDNAAPWSVFPALALHLFLVFLACKKHVVKYVSKR